MAEAGRQSRDVGPFLAIVGTDAATPEPAIPPAVTEILVNLDIDRNGRAVVRPGSHFVARLGTGPVLGLHEHTFERGDFERRLVGVVAAAYDEVHTGYASDDPAGGELAGFVPDVTQDGAPISKISARTTDRFHFQSFLNRLYFAGSSISHALYEHNFSTGATKVIDGVRGRSVVAEGNRLYVAGDPVFPNRIYPSEPDDPTTFDPNLAFQVGTRTDGILGLREHEGLIVVLGERSCSWVLAGDISIGDIQVESFTSRHGVVGPIAHDTGGDGFIYWLSREDGIVRWRRGMDSPDATFAGDIHELVETVVKATSPEELRGAAVRWDPEAQAVRFEIPGANLLVSYFPYQGQGWTVGASTTSTSKAALLREYDRYDPEVGEDRYTALASRRDRSDDNERIMAGDAEGHVWMWSRGEPDKLRWDSSVLPVEFDCLMRWGNVELAPIGYRAVIENVLLDFLGGYEFDFDLWVEADYSTFVRTNNVSREVDGGDLPLTLWTEGSAQEDESRVLARRLHPMHVRVSNWAAMIGKVFRIQLTWSRAVHQAFVGLELEVSPEAHDATQILTPPEPNPEVVELLGFGQDGTGTVDGTPTEPHDPPDNPNVPPEVNYVATGSVARAATDDLSFVDHDLEPVLGDNLSLLINFDSWTSGGGVGFGFIIISEDEVDLWGIPQDDNDDRQLVHFTVDPDFVSNPVKDYEYDMMQDALGSGFGGNLGTYGIRGCFYFEGSDELWVFLSHRGGDNSKFNTLVAYDVSDKSSPPVAGYAENMGTSFLVANFLDADSRGYIYVGRGGSMEVVLPVRSGGTITSLAVQDSALSIGGGQNDVYTTRIYGNSLLVICNQSNGNILVYDISDPTALVLLDTYNVPSDGAGAEARPFSPTFSPDGQTLFVGVATSENAAGVPPSGVGVVAYDLSDVGGVGLVRLGTYENLSAVSGLIHYDAVHFYSGLSGDDAVIYWAVDGTITTLDVSNPAAMTLIDSAASNVFQPVSIGMAGGPGTVQFSGGGLLTEPSAVSANIAAIRDGGSIVLVGTEDEGAPVLEAFIEFDPRGPASMRFSVDGQHLFVLAQNPGELRAYSLGSDFGLAGTLTDPDLAGGEGMVVGLDEQHLYILNASNEVVKVLVSDPTAMSIVSVDAAGPTGVPYGDAAATGDGTSSYVYSRGELTERQGQYGALGMHNGLWSMLDTDTPARSWQHVPEAQRAVKNAVMDATYLYGVNWLWRQRQLVIVDHTDALLPVVGSLVHEGLVFTPDNRSWSVAAGGGVFAAISNARSLKASLGLDDIYLYDVSTPSAPAFAASLDVAAGATALAIIGDYLLVAGGSGVSWDLRSYDVSNPAAPSLVDEVTGTDAVFGLQALGTGTHVVGFVGAQARCYSVSGAGALAQVGTVALSGTPTYSTPINTDQVAYFAAQGDTLGLVDFGTPASPSELDTDTVAEGLSSVVDVGGSPTGDMLFVLKTSLGDGRGFLLPYDVSGNSLAAISDAYSAMTDREEELVRWTPYHIVGNGSKVVLARDIFYRGLSRLDASGAAPTLDHSVPPYQLDALHFLFNQDAAIAYSASPQRVWRMTLTDRDNPRLVATYVRPEGSILYEGYRGSALNESGDVLYVAREDGVYAYDVSVPLSDSIRLGRHTTSEQAQLVRMSGGGETVYAIEGEGGYDLSGRQQNATLLILDFTTPGTPTVVGRVQLPAGFAPEEMELY